LIAHSVNDTSYYAFLLLKTVSSIDQTTDDVFGFGIQKYPPFFLGYNIFVQRNNTKNYGPVGFPFCHSCQNDDFVFNIWRSLFVRHGQGGRTPAFDTYINLSFSLDMTFFTVRRHFKTDKSAIEITPTPVCLDTYSATAAALVDDDDPSGSSISKKEYYSCPLHPPLCCLNVMLWTLLCSEAVSYKKAGYWT
jgi:hypothetical protein